MAFSRSSSGMFKWMQRSLRVVFFSCSHSGYHSRSGRSIQYVSMSVANRMPSHHRRSDVSKNSVTYMHRAKKMEASRRFLLLLFNFMLKWLTAFNWIPLSIQLIANKKRTERDDGLFAFSSRLSSVLILREAARRAWFAFIQHVYFSFE